LSSNEALALPLDQHFTKDQYLAIREQSKKNKEERYSRVPRLSDTRYSKGNGDMQAAKRDYLNSLALIVPRSQRSSGQTDGQTDRRTWLDRLG